MRTLAKLLWLIVLAPSLLLGLAVGFIGLMLEKEEVYR